MSFTDEVAQALSERGVEVQRDVALPREAEWANAPPAPPDPPPEALFDRSQYEREELRLPKTDGRSIDKIRVKFSGSVLLDRLDPSDVELFRALALGQVVALRVEGQVAYAGTGWTTDRDGNLDAVIGERTLKVETIWLPGDEEAAAA
jgi:hypothetical protein